MHSGESYLPRRGSGESRGRRLRVRGSCSASRRPDCSNRPRRSSISARLANLCQEGSEALTTSSDEARGDSGGCAAATQPPLQVSAWSSVVLVILSEVRLQPVSEALV